MLAISKFGLPWIGALVFCAMSLVGGPANAFHLDCGNGIVEDDEVCDDGAINNRGACLLDCTPATCGDGYGHDGVEECDDANSVDDDLCANDCTVNTICGDADASGSITARDALFVLRNAVGDADTCIFPRCDVNRDQKILASDALQTLQWAVGIGSAAECVFSQGLFVEIQESVLLGALQFTVNYRDAPIEDIDLSTCTIQGGLLGAVNKSVNKELKVGMIDLDGFDHESLPLLLICHVEASSGPSLKDFTVNVVDAGDTSSNQAPHPELVATSR